MIAVHVKRNLKNKIKNKPQTQPSGIQVTVLYEPTVSFPWLGGATAGLWVHHVMQEGEGVTLGARVRALPFIAV